jgi:ABC-2 type transport system ATP-binding protein
MSAATLRLEASRSPSLDAPALEIKNLTKVYAGPIRAVDDLSLSVKQGEIFGLLGPNGAGKSTVIRSVLTLTRHDAGEIRVLGIDVWKNQLRARRLMGYVPQEVSVDGDLTGYENLLFFAKLYGVERGERLERITRAIGTMGLEDRADSMVKTYSGGMMRRLEIAQALVNQPKLLFLDEPSIGLDPGARQEVWKHIAELRESLGATVFITTHDMHEAERLCDRIAVLNNGKIVATGSPDELKAGIGGEVVVLKLGEGTEKESLGQLKFPAELEASLMKGIDYGSRAGGPDEVSILVKGSAEEAAPRVAKAFENSGIEIQSISMSKPTLDDVFLKFTKTRIAEVETFKAAKSNRRSFRRHAR